jgi:hypothetical protein
MTKKSFALIYTMMFVALTMITMSSIAVLSTSGSRQMQESKSATEAYQLAQSAVEDGMQRGTGTKYYGYCYISDMTCAEKTGANAKTDLDNLVLDSTKDSLGYYKLYIENNKIIGKGYAPWGKKNSTGVTLEADSHGSGYQIYQIGD